MKSSKLSAEDRKIRRELIAGERVHMLRAHQTAGRSFLQSKTKRRIFSETLTNGIVSTSEYGCYPHSSTRQRVRYARQIAAGKLHTAGASR
jgi:hypothetical protein